MEHVAKLSPKKHLPTLITRAVPGLPLEYFPVPPPGLPRRANSLYFRIDHTSTLWLDVESTKILSLFWDTAPSDLKAELVVLGS
jgi:type VI secretion system protein ImpJ